MEDIDHTRTKARSPQTNGICERFHRTIQDEFYRIAFRRRLYASIEELQRDLDVWMEEYNTQRTHTGKYCYGKTPMQTFLDAKQIALEKHLDKLDESGKFRSLGEAETGSGGDQPARNSPADWNGQEVGLAPTSLTQNHSKSDA